MRYEAVIANSNTIDSTGNERLEIPNRIDLGPGKTFFGRIAYDDYRRPFKPGLSLMRNEVLESAQSGGYIERGKPLVSQMVYGLDLRYESRRFSLLSEVYYIENEAQPGVGDGRKHDSLAWFAQIGYRLNERTILTYRYESPDFDSRPGNVDADYRDPLLGRQSQHETVMCSPCATISANPTR